MLDLPARHARLAAALPLEDALLVVGAGAPIPLPENTDQTYPFRAHSDYFHLTGLECPHGVVAYDPRDRAWHSFVPAVTEAERVWEGREQPPGEPLAHFAAWLAARPGRRIAQLGAAIPGVVADAAFSADIRAHFLHARRPKDAAELATLRRSAAATAAGYAALRAALRPGVTERALQVELETGFFRAGAQRTGYGSIVAAGTNAAVLHFAPGERVAQAGDFVLVDAGLLPGRPKDPRPCLRTLRMDLPLAPGYVVTVEPGLYFIPALLNDPARREQFRDCVNWKLADQHLGIGGVRIEDNLVITAGEPENLTAAIPKEI